MMGETGGLKMGSLLDEIVGDGVWEYEAILAQRKIPLWVPTAEETEFGIANLRPGGGHTSVRRQHGPIKLKLSRLDGESGTEFELREMGDEVNAGRALRKDDSICVAPAPRFLEAVSREHAKFMRIDENRIIVVDRYAPALPAGRASCPGSQDSLLRTPLLVRSHPCC